MTATKVLVVDDSPTMRALISSVIEQIPNVEVVGAADGAANARDLIPRLRPDVLTLDVEMPGMSGIEFLAEIMGSRPIPVIMFSTRTTEGAADSIEALRLGAIDCFCKPRIAAPKDFDAILVKLGKRIKTAKGTAFKPARSAAMATAAIGPIDWNGRLLVIGGDASSTATLFDVMGAFPANCPPTLVVQHLGPGLVDGMAAKLDKQIAPQVVVATDGMLVEQGKVYLAPAGEHHLVVDAWPAGRLRLLAQNPVAGERPSISLLFAAAARAAGGAAVGLLLNEDSEDGGSGLKALNAAGAYTFSAADGGGYTLARNSASQPVASAALPVSILKMCSK